MMLNINMLGPIVMFRIFSNINDILIIDKLLREMCITWRWSHAGQKLYVDQPPLVNGITTIYRCFWKITCSHMPHVLSYALSSGLCLKLLLREHIWSAPFLLIRMLSSNLYSLYASKQALDTPIYIVIITIYIVFNLFLNRLKVLVST